MCARWVVVGCVGLGGEHRWGGGGKVASIRWLCGEGVMVVPSVGFSGLGFGGGPLALCGSSVPDGVMCRWRRLFGGDSSGVFRP